MAKSWDQIESELAHLGSRYATLAKDVREAREEESRPATRESMSAASKLAESLARDFGFGDEMPLIAADSEATAVTLPREVVENGGVALVGIVVPPPQ